MYRCILKETLGVSGVLLGTLGLTWLGTKQLGVKKVPGVYVYVNAISEGGPTGSREQALKRPYRLSLSPVNSFCFSEELWYMGDARGPIIVCVCSQAILAEAISAQWDSQ